MMKANTTSHSCALCPLKISSRARWMVEMISLIPSSLFSLASAALDPAGALGLGGKERRQSWTPPTAYLALSS